MRRLMLLVLMLPSLLWGITIYEIQYTEDPTGASPYVGEEVEVSGIVTAVFGSTAFFIQEDIGAWHGVYVYDKNSAFPVCVGDSVTVYGEVSEYYDKTEISYLTDVVIHKHNCRLPEPVSVPTGEIAQEMYEGVLVRVDSVVVTNADAGYGQWYVDDGSGDCIIDDMGSYTYTPVYNDSLLSIIGVVDYSYSEFKIEPRTDVDIWEDYPASGVGYAYVSPNAVGAGKDFDLYIYISPYPADGDTIKVVDITIPLEFGWSGSVDDVSAPQEATVSITGDGTSTPFVVKIEGVTIVEETQIGIMGLSAPSTVKDVDIPIATSASSASTASLMVLPTVSVLSVAGSGLANLNPYYVEPSDTVCLLLTVSPTIDTTLGSIGRVAFSLPTGWNFVSVPEVVGGVVIESDSVIVVDSIACVDSFILRVQALSDSAVGADTFYVATGTIGGDVVELESMPVIVVSSTLFSDITPIGDVQTVGDDGVSSRMEGETVKVKGVVTGASSVFNPTTSTTSFWIQDETGGVNVYCPAYADMDIEEGMEVIVEGTVIEYNGLTEVKYSDEGDIWIISDTSAVVLPETLAISCDFHEEMEGRLVYIGKVKVATLPYQAGSALNFEVWNGRAVLEIRALEGTGLYDTLDELERGDYLNLTGIVTQYDTDEPYTSGYELLLRNSGDLEFFAFGEEGVESASMRVYPNPVVFRDGEVARFEVLVPSGWRVTLRIVDARGRLVATLLENVWGSSFTEWLGRDDRGNIVPPGYYIGVLDCIQEDGNLYRIKKPVVIAGGRR